jgi:hypothetical protein
METSLGGISFKPAIIGEIEFGKAVKAILDYKESRKKLEKEAEQETAAGIKAAKELVIGDLKSILIIVKALTSQYIDLMQQFATYNIVKDHDSLENTIKAANDYLFKRDLLPDLDGLAGKKIICLRSGR